MISDMSLSAGGLARQVFQVFTVLLESGTIAAPKSQCKGTWVTSKQVITDGTVQGTGYSLEISFSYNRQDIHRCSLIQSGRPRKDNILKICRNGGLTPI